MPDVRTLAVAALCALPLVAAACGGGDDGGSNGGAGTGEDLYRQYACASCHTLDGSEGTGPSLFPLPTAGTAA